MSIIVQRITPNNKVFEVILGLFKKSSYLCKKYGRTSQHIRIIMCGGYGSEVRL